MQVSKLTSTGGQQIALHGGNLTLIDAQPAEVINRMRESDWSVVVSGLPTLLLHPAMGTSAPDDRALGLDEDRGILAVGPDTLARVGDCGRATASAASDC